jgi:hypothetical protein
MQGFADRFTTRLKVPLNQDQFKGSRIWTSMRIPTRCLDPAVRSGKISAILANGSCTVKVAGR